MANSCESRCITEGYRVIIEVLSQGNSNILSPIRVNVQSNAFNSQLYGLLLSISHYLVLDSKDEDLRGRCRIYALPPPSLSWPSQIALEEKAGLPSVCSAPARL